MGKSNHKNNTKNTSKQSKQSKLKQYFESWKSWSFAKSFSFKSPFSKTLIYDLTCYIINLSIIIFVLAKIKALSPSIEKISTIASLTPQQAAEVGLAVQSLKFYILFAVILILTNTTFWRAFIMKTYYNRKEKWYNFALFSLILFLYRFVLTALLILISYLLVKALTPSALKIAGPLALFVYIYFYITFQHGLSSNPSWKVGIKSFGKLLASPKSVGLVIIASYLILTVLTKFTLLFIDQNSTSGKFALAYIFPVLLFLILNWSRYYMYLVSSKILSEKQ